MRKIWKNRRPHPGDIVYIVTKDGKRITGIYQRATKDWYYLATDTQKKHEFRIYKENVKHGESLKREVTKWENNKN